MGLAEKHAEILALYLGTGRKPTRAEYERSKAHGIPQGFNPGASMNWWVLAVGVRMAYGDKSEWPAAMERFGKENTEYGVWGSEQHSPNYWGFHLLGRLTMAKTLKSFPPILDHQIGDLLTYGALAMSLHGDEVFWAGMRGTGLPEFSSYEFFYLVRRAMGEKAPKAKKYWKQDIYKWITDKWVNQTLRHYYVTVSSFRNPLGIRSPTHFMEFEELTKWVYTEDDQHSSTGMRGGGGRINGKRYAAPANYYIKDRGEGASGAVHTQYDPATRNLKIVYSGPYNDLPDAKPIIFDDRVPKLVSHFVWDKDGLRDQLSIDSNVSSVPQIPAGGGPPKRESKWNFL